MTNPWQESMQLAERAAARQLRRQQAVKDGTIRDFIRAEAKAARERYKKLTGESEPMGSGEVGEGPSGA